MPKRRIAAAQAQAQAATDTHLAELLEGGASGEIERDVAQREFDRRLHGHRRRARRAMAAVLCLFLAVVAMVAAYAVWA